MRKNIASLFNSKVEALLRCVTLGSLMLTIASPLAAQIAAGSENVIGTTTRELRAKARPDECYRGLGQNKLFAVPPCTEGTPKVNQGYVWAVAEAGEDVWFGTFANGHCITRGTVVADPESLVPLQTFVCLRVGVGRFHVSFTARVVDFRAPQSVYNKSQKLHRPTPRSDDTRPTIPLNPQRSAPRGPRVGNLIMLGAVP